MNPEQEVAHILLDVGAVKLAKEPIFTFTSGIQSQVYCDNRLLISHPRERKKIVDLYIELLSFHIGRSNVDVIAGTASSGIPFAAWIAHQLDAPMVYVRPQAKEHGQMKQVEGVLNPGDRAVLIEDHISTGGSAIRSIEALRREGAVCDHCLAIFGYNSEHAQQTFKDKGIDLQVLCDFSVLLEVAKERRILEENNVADLREWAVTRF
jgi:orotate phosphoribosyltransferase